MIGTGFDVRVKIQDILASQLPEFILSDSPLTDDFLKQFYVSQEFQGGAVDFASNLDQYLNLKDLTTSSTPDIQLTADISSSSDVISVTSTKGFPNEWGLLKVGDEIITYTGVTTNTFTGAIRGFSGITAYSAPNDPSNLVFEATSAASHAAGDDIQNLSVLFLEEFYNKLKFTFAPGFENIDTSSDINAATWIQNVRSFFQSKGSEESIKILFKVLYGEDPTVIDLEEYLIKPSYSEYNRADYAIVLPISGNPVTLLGKTVKQSNANIFGSITQIEPFIRSGRTYYKVFYFVSTEELSSERKSFTVPGRTKVHREWDSTKQSLTVDTTIGFNDGKTFVDTEGTRFTYADKTVNQFLGVTCEDPEKVLLPTSEISDEIYIIGTNDDDEEVKLLLTGVISEVTFVEDPILLKKDEEIFVDTLGENIQSARVTRNKQSFKEIVANSFIYNTSVRFDVIEVSGTVFSINNSYLDEAFIRVGDTVDILASGTNTAYAVNKPVTEVSYENATITVEDISGVPSGANVDIRRNQNYANSFSVDIEYGNEALLSNTLNTYDATEFDGTLLVATNSLPSYDIDISLTENIITDINSDNLENYDVLDDSYEIIRVPQNVDFLTGERIVYSVEGGAEPICDTGSYIVEVLGNRKFRLYASASFIGTQSFIPLKLTTAPGQHIFTLESQRDRVVSGTNKFVKIPIPTDRTNVSPERTPQKIDEGDIIGLLTNGVEIKTYRGRDTVYYGPLTSVDVISGGDFYSVITPPKLTIADSDIPGAATAEATVAMKGKLDKILIDPQDFDINQVFSITVTGGNSSGASAEAQIEERNRTITFDSREFVFGGGIDPDNDSITFPADHNIQQAEPLTYNNRGNPSIQIGPYGGSNSPTGATLSNGGVYYPNVLNSRTIEIYESLGDLTSGINTIGFTAESNAFGIQSFETKLKPQIVAATIIDDGGFFYNRSITVNGRDSVSFPFSEIVFPNHGFETGEEIVYTGTGNPIRPLVRDTSYLVWKISDDSFRLSEIGPSGDRNFNLDRLDYIVFENLGGANATHTFSYPEIVAEVVVSSSSLTNPTVVATPFIRGEIERVYITEAGFYGSDILNFEKVPSVDVSEGRLGKIVPIISDGVLGSVQILSKGRNYTESPELTLIDPTGSGQGAVLRAVVEDGEIVDVVIINGGFSYSGTSKIEIKDVDRRAILASRVRPLTVNDTFKNGFESLDDSRYSVLSYDRVIRENVYSDIGEEHSPIIGWAKDGNPIYGPFGYSEADNVNSDIRALVSSYAQDSNNIPGRPNELKYPIGFFVDDYKYTGSGDLDLYNGRYCKTPEFPEGIYAYFATVDPAASSFNKTPVYPYFIGEFFRDSPKTTEDELPGDYDFSGKPIYRNTFPYALGNPYIGSEFIDQSYLTDLQAVVVTDVNSGDVSTVSVVGAGQSYAVGDVAVFDSSEDYLSARVSQIEGVRVDRVSLDTLSYSRELCKVVRHDTDKIRFYIDGNHEYLDGDSVNISGLSTSLEKLSGANKIRVETTSMSLYSPFEPSVFNGVFDIFVNTLNSDVSVGSSVVIRNDELEDEYLSVLNIFPVNKALRVERSIGYGATHPIGSIVDLVPNFFDIDNSELDFQSELDHKYFFNPAQSMGFGVEPGVGVGLVYSIGNINYDISVQTQSIFMPNNSFRKNEKVIMGKAPFADSIQAFDVDGNVYVIPQNFNELFIHKTSKDYIGLKTSKTAEPLLFAPPAVADGVDDPKYFLETERYYEDANLDRFSAVVRTKEDHLLDNNDIINLNVISDRVRGNLDSTEVNVFFDEPRQLLITDPQSANSIEFENNLIELPDHGYVSGDLLFYSTDGAEIDGLLDGRSYFVILFDVNKFYLAETFRDTVLGFELPINLGSAGSGTHTFFKVNPQIKAISNNHILFNTSDSSLDDYELKIFADEALTEIIENNSIDEDFVVSSTPSQLLLSYSENNPRTFYYALTKDGILVQPNTSAPNNNSIIYVDSEYNSVGTISTISSREFRFPLGRKPSSPIYDVDSEDCDINYTTRSTNTLGPVSEIEIVSSGKNFTKLPGFITIDSATGTNAQLKANSENIATIAAYRIQNPGWGYYADSTLRPQGKIQPKIDFTNSDFITDITVINGGNGYQTPPQPVLIDSETRQSVETGSISIDIQSSVIVNVDINLSPTGLSKNNHELFVIDGDNGIPVLAVLSVDNNSGKVVYEMQTPISGYNIQPFEVGDRVFIENVIGVGETTTYLNSPDIGYRFPVVTNVLPFNPVQITVEYPEEYWDLLGEVVEDQNSFSTIVNKRNYPEFKVSQATAILVVGERLSFVNEQGITQDTDLIVEESSEEFFKVRGNFDIRVGDVFKGNVSGIIVTVTNFTNQECSFEINSISRFANGWNDTVGFMNEETQALPDNDYYQNLSYSIKSSIEFKELIGPINKLVHPAGLKNFADTKIESSSSVGVSGITTDSITIDLIGLTDVSDTPLRVDRINTFDLGYDDEVLNNKSTQVRFNSLVDYKRLTNYIALKTNRVLLMDDISSEFIDSDNTSKVTRYVDFDIANSPMVRVVGQIRNPVDDGIQLVESVMLFEGGNAVTLQKAVVSSNNNLGFGEIAGDTSESPVVRYTPFDEFVEEGDVDLKILSTQYLSDQSPDSFDIGYARLISRNGVVAPGQTVTIYTSRNTSALAAYVQTRENVALTTDLRYTELYAFTSGGDSYIAEYTVDATATTGFSNNNSDLQYKSTALSSNRVELSVTNNGDKEYRYDVKLTEFINTPTGSTVYRFKRGSIPVGTEKSVNLQTTYQNTISSNPDIVLLTLDGSEFQTARCMVNVRGTQLNAIYQVMIANSDGNAYATTYPFIEEGDDGVGIGTFGATLTGNDFSLHFYPEAGIPTEAIQIMTYTEGLIRENDYRNYVDEPLEYGVVNENYYIAPYNAPFGQRRDRIRFPLTYQGIPIYEKNFEPDQTVNLTSNVFNIPDHFFSDLEEVYYLPADSVNGPTAPMTIAPVTDYLGNTVTQMPERLWILKSSLNAFRVAANLADAQAGRSIDIIDFGVGNDHRIGMTKKSEKTIITIDGIVQSPIANTNLAYGLSEAVDIDEEYITLAGIGTIRSGDLLKIEDEIVNIVDVGFSTSSEGPISNSGSFPLIKVLRGAAGTIATSHSQSQNALLFKGSYNIVESEIVFTEAPSGKGNIDVNESNMVDINSTFQGRTFLQKEYDQIKIYDDISNQFDGTSDSYEITYNGQQVPEIENGSGILLINDVYQTPTTDNNEGNNYFYDYDTSSGINSVIFTGITSSNGERVASELDVNQNQIPRGGLVVSVGSTPGLGYAPLVGAIIEPVVVGGVIQSVDFTEGPGSTTNVQYARYNHISGEMIVSLRGPQVSSALAVISASYTNNSGLLVVTTNASLSSAGIVAGDILQLNGLQFSCTSGGAPSQKAFPDEDPLFVVDTIISDNTLTIFVGASDIEHTYVSGGTMQKYDPFEFDKEELNPQFVYLQNLTFSCPSGTPNNGTTVFPDVTDNFPVVRRIDGAHILVYVGASDFPHFYENGGTIGAYSKLTSGSGYNRTVNIDIYEEGHTGTPAVIEGVPGAGGALSFNIINGGSGYNDPDLFAPDPDYFNLPIKAISRRNGTVETGKNLFVTVNVGAAKTTAIGRSEFFEVESFDITNQGYAFEEGDVVEVVGLVTDARLPSGVIEPFQLTITRTFNDNFTAYNFGELDYIDSIKNLQNGRRTRFPLIYEGTLLSFEIDPNDEDSSAIDTDSILLIFVNTVLQVPGESYTFNGGTSFQFLLPPREEDDIDIYFYRGKRLVDIEQVQIPGETIKPGDEIQLRKNDSYDPSKTQNIRTVTEIIESDTVRTSIYVGNDDLETVKPRPVAWDKQKRDLFIYGEPVTKTRDSLESVIKPISSIVKSVEAGDTEILLANADLFDYEETLGSVIPTFQARMYSPYEVEPVQLQVIMTGGSVSSVNVLNPLTNSGYSQGSTIRFNTSPTGQRATANLLISGNRVAGVNVTSGGAGYQTTPTFVVSEPESKYEDIEEIGNLEGWGAIITRITAGSQGPFNKSIVMEYETVDPLVLSGDLKPGYRIAVNNTFVGDGVQAYGPNSSNLIASGSNYLNCVYEVISNTPTALGGTLVVYVSSTTNLNGINSSGGNLGSFSWGRLSNITPPIANQFLVDPLRYDDYFAEYPQLRRTSEGLRNRGGLGKKG